MRNEKSDVAKTFVVYGFKGHERRYYARDIESRDEAEALALRIAETAMNSGSRAPLVIVEPTEPPASEVVGETITATTVLVAIDKNVEDLYANRIDHETFGVRQRAAWRAAEAKGVNEAVTEALRLRGQATVRPTFKLDRDADRRRTSARYGSKARRS